ncbi:hypothetical protein [Brachybacterium atlanticum]|uniref:hypothetical protein n=1 Tax=Brachybacterium atlanticum TaxID=2911888 RepID=UPI0021E0E76E|nr:hypothetical protein [Brachybacterium atlanticum]
MASLIESVRKLHGPTLVEHDNGYDVDVVCPECTRLRSEALDQASTDGEAGAHVPELAHVPYPCQTRVVAGTSAAEGKDESARMRLEHLVVQREQLEERIERLDAVIGLIRRDLGDAADEPAAIEESPAKPPSTGAKDPASEAAAEDAPATDTTSSAPKQSDDYDF